MSVRPRNRQTISNGPTAIDGATCVDRYLKAIDGLLRVDGAVFAMLERDFVDVAKQFGERRGITYETWREVGVSDAVLQRAEIAFEVANL